jgi:hypothetical protein
MAKKNEKHLNAKQVAYEKQQEKEGTNVVMWIIGSLILLGLVYIGWSVWMMA